MSVLPLSQQLARPDPAHIPISAKMIALLGESKRVHPLILQSLVIRAARGERLAVVVGDNRFDAYYLARLARAHGLNPAALLSRVTLSRPFTCYQLPHRILSLRARDQHTCDALYVTGLLETFYDEDVKAGEAVRLLTQTLNGLKTLAAEGLPILVSMALPRLSGRESFGEIVKRAADACWEPAPSVLERGNARQLAFAEIF